jgi:SAM-dependent methyltransferase
MDEWKVPSELRRNVLTDQVALVDAAVWLIEHMCQHVGVADLGDLDVLDFGCGLRFTQAFLNRGVPIGRYVGVDVSADVIEFLRAHVTDRRFEYVHLNAHNDRYNPTGVPLCDLTVPELDGRRFDLICLFSVFTHLSPADYVAMLRLLRRFVKADGRLFYTLFVHERTEGGHGYVDAVSRSIERSDRSFANDAMAQQFAKSAEPPDFHDARPSEPLLFALYSRRHALELIEGTGWEVRGVFPPDVHLQHHIVCAPRS